VAAVGEKKRGCPLSPSYYQKYTSSFPGALRKEKGKERRVPPKREEPLPRKERFFFS